MMLQTLIGQKRLEEEQKQQHAEQKQQHAEIMAQLKLLTSASPPRCVALRAPSPKSARHFVFIPALLFVPRRPPSLPQLHPQVTVRASRDLPVICSCQTFQMARRYLSGKPRLAPPPVLRRSAHDFCSAFAMYKQHALRLASPWMAEPSVHITMSRKLVLSILHLQATLWGHACYL